MKTIIIILLSFTLTGLASAQLVRKNLIMPKAVHSVNISSKKFAGKHVEKRKQFMVPKKNVVISRSKVGSIPVDSKKK